MAEVAEKILTVGKGALLSKFDIARAYRNVPICPADRHLLGMHWNGKYYVDLTLPFGLRSACTIFNSVGDLIAAILNKDCTYSEIEHYLDDFITVGNIRLHDADRNILKEFKEILRICEELGIKLADDKTVWPTTRLIFLGFLLDTISLTIQIPEQKLTAYRFEVAKASASRSIRKKHLDSLLGKLLHAAFVIPIGRAFLRTLINKNAATKRRFAWISLSVEDRSNLKWWLTLFDNWNGITLMRFRNWAPAPDLELSSDAALKEGFGIVCGDSWVSGTWPADAPKNIAVLELIPIVLAAMLWGNHWTGKCILFHTDSMAAHCSAESLLPRDPHLASLIRELAIISIEHDFHFQTKHLPGKQNVAADLLSRNRHAEFFKIRPTAMRKPFCENVDSLVDRLIALRN